MSARSERMALFQKVFNNDDGKEVLAHILNRLGYFADVPGAIVPDNIAVANWLLRCIGITEPEFIPGYISGVVAGAPSPAKVKIFDDGGKYEI